MPGAGSNRINEFGFYTNYYTLPIDSLHAAALRSPHEGVDTVDRQDIAPAAVGGDAQLADVT